MYQVGQQVIYGIHGVCRIIALEMKSMGGQRKEYYVLEPIDQPGAAFYVPSGNQAAVAKMRPIMTREQIFRLLHSEEVRRDAWIADENQRKQRYRELLSGDDRAALMCMMHTLYLHKQNQLAVGRKFHLCDENFLHDAQRVLHTEFALVMDLEADQVGPFIRQQMGIE